MAKFSNPVSGPSWWCRLLTVIWWRKSSGPRVWPLREPTWSPGRSTETWEAVPPDSSQRESPFLTFESGQAVLTWELTGLSLQLPHIQMGTVQSFCGIHFQDQHMSSVHALYSSKLCSSIFKLLVSVIAALNRCTAMSVNVLCCYKTVHENAWSSPCLPFPVFFFPERERIGWRCAACSGSSSCARVTSPSSPMTWTRW